MMNSSPFITYTLDFDIHKTQHIKKKICINQQVIYYVLNYDKHFITFDNEEAAKYRSVVFSFPQKKVLCFSPPRSLDFDKFNEKYPQTDGSNIFANEAIEGVMINLFYDNRMQKWEIATKSSVGGQCWFYATKSPSKKTFYRMFLDALSAGDNQELNDLPCFTFFPKWATFSFVLQHPENPMILPVIIPKVYLVAVYRRLENRMEYIQPFIYQRWAIFKNLEGIMAFPQMIPLPGVCNNNGVMNTHCREKASMGVMIWNTDTGERTKWVNPNYESMKIKRQIHPFIPYLYFCLRRMNTAIQQNDPLAVNHLAVNPLAVNHLANFIESSVTKKSTKQELQYVDDEFQYMVQLVYNAYVNHFIHKNAPFSQSDSTWLHAKKIHNTIYLPSIRRNQKIVIQYKTILEYFDHMEPRELLYLFCENRRDEHLLRQK